MTWKFWKRKEEKENISEPVITLAKEIEVFDNWNYDFNLNIMRHVLKHKTKDISLRFALDMYDYWQCTEEYLSKDEHFYLGRYLGAWYKEYKQRQDDEKKLKNFKERQRVSKELGIGND